MGKFRISISNLIIYGSGLAFLAMAAGLNPAFGVAALTLSTIAEIITVSLQSREIQKQQDELRKLFDAKYEETNVGEFQPTEPLVN